MMRHWKGWDSVNCLERSKVTQSWCEKWNTVQANFYPNHDPKHVVVIILETTTQSQSPPTIHYTNNDRYEGLRCCEMAESIQKHSILVWKVESRGLEPKLSPPATQKPWYGDGYEGWIPISTSHSHSSYSYWDIWMVGMIRTAWIGPKSLNLGVKRCEKKPSCWHFSLKKPFRLKILSRNMCGNIPMHK